MVKPFSDILHCMKYKKEIPFLIITILTTWLLVYISKHIQSMSFLPHWFSNAVIHQLAWYQIITLTVAGLFLALLFACYPKAFQKYARIGNLAAPATPNKLFGITAKDSWNIVGRNFAIIITLVTAAVIWIPLYDDATFSWLLLWTLPLAAINAFVEEAITRFSVVVILRDTITPNNIAIVSALIFGTVHFFGTPGGIHGMFLAGILGLLLAKSIIETRGVFWAWGIHFLQDIVIISALIAVAS